MSTRASHDLHQKVKKEVTAGIISAFRKHDDFSNVSIDAMEKVIASALTNVSTIDFKGNPSGQDPD